MNLFKSYKFSWKQIAVFKLALFSIGAIIGAYFASFVKDYLVLFVIIAILSSLYIMLVALKQTK